MRLISAYGDDRRAESVLYDLLQERPTENWISHMEMPSRDEHRRFIAGRPFLHWYVIEEEGHLVGSLECTDRNEIGVAIFKRFRRKGYGAAAVMMFRQSHEPLPAIPAIRNGRWLANIATHNIGSKLFFAELGFKAIQETWAL